MICFPDTPITNWWKQHGNKPIEKGCLVGEGQLFCTGITPS